MMKIRRIGILTAGGLAPCLSAAIGYLIDEYSRLLPETEILCYRYGYAGVLRGDSFLVTLEMRKQAQRFLKFGGSPIGNSRVKLTNIADCVRRGLVKSGEDPQVVAAQQLERDQLDVLHTIGGDDTNAVAAQLAAHLALHHYDLAVIGLPKTIDNDVVPLSQTLGAHTAAAAGARFFENIVSESTTNPRMLVIHEIMGRNCGWLVYETAKNYRQWLREQSFVTGMGPDRTRWDIHGIYIPELPLDIEAEKQRLLAVINRVGNVNLFVGEGAGIESILEDLQRRDMPIPRDAFGHVKLDMINPGKWFGNQFAEMLHAEKTLVQKSGYFARSAPADDFDLDLIHRTVKAAVRFAQERKSGVVGLDEDRQNEMSLVDFSRIRGGKPFNAQLADFQQMLREIGQISVEKSQKSFTK